MRILGIGGSPGKGGFTNKLLDAALNGAASGGGVVPEKIILNELIFKPCQECGGCDKTGRCVFKDDMEIVYKKFKEADAVIIASPIFFGSVSAQLKMMIDRFQTAWVSKYILKKYDTRKARRKGIFLCAAGQDKKEYFENARQIVRIFFTTLDIDYIGELFFGGYNTKSRDDKEKKSALERAFELGASLLGA